MLKNNGLTGSMGRVGACGDNAAMESFFALLQKNVLDQKRWESRDELSSAGSSGPITADAGNGASDDSPRSSLNSSSRSYKLLEDTTNRVETKPSADPESNTNVFGVAVQPETA